MYYRLDFRCSNLNTYYAGEVIELDIVIHTGQIGSLENSEGNIYNVGSINQMQTALKNSLPGDTIRITQNFDYPYDLVLNKRVSLDLNTFTLSINNLIVEFSNPGVWKVNTPASSTLTVRNDVYINTPNCNVELQGSYEYSIDMKVGGTVEIGASYTEGTEFLQQFKLTDLDSNLKEITMLHNSSIFVESNTTIGKIKSAEEITWVKIINYGNIESINLESISFIVSSADSNQIYIESYGQIYGTVEGTEANIKLPFDSNPKNTHIYQSSIASYINVYCEGGGYDNNDVIRDSSAGYVTYIENVDNAVKEYRVILNDNIDQKPGTTSLLLGVLLEGYIDHTTPNTYEDGYFDSMDEVKAITRLTIVTTRGKNVSLSQFYRVGTANATNFPNLTHLDLSLAYIENDIITNNAFANVNLQELYLPKSTVAINGSSRTNGAFANSNIGFVNIPGNVLNFYDGWDYYLNTVYMETDKLEVYLNSIYAPSNYADNLDTATILVSDVLIDYLEEISMSRYDITLKHYLRYKRRGTLDSSGKYWIKKNEAGNGYIITAIDSRINVNESTFRLPDELSLDGVNFLPVTEIASYACTRLVALQGNLVIGSNTKTVGMYAFYNIGAQGINTGGVETLNNRGTFSRDTQTSGVSINLVNVNQIKGPIMFNLYNNTSFSAPKLLSISSYDSISDEKYVFDNNGFTSFSAPILQSISSYGIKDLKTIQNFNLSSVTYLGNYALYGSNSVLSLNLSSVTLMENYAVSNYSVMTSINLNGLVEAKNYAIANCDLLEALNMPSLESADYYAFFELNDVENITANSLTTATNNAFTGFDSLINVSMNSLEYSANYTIYDAPALTSLSLPNIQYIDKLYGECPRLATLTMSSPRNTTIGSPIVTLKITPRSFQEYQGLVTLSSTNATEIGYQAFYGITTLRTVSLPNLVVATGTSIFANCNSLQSVEINSLVDMGQSMFANDMALVRVNAASLETVSQMGFYNCIALSRIYNSGYSSTANGLYAPNIVTIGSQAFYNNTGMASATLLNTTAIYEKAFYGDASLTTITFRDLNTVGEQAFFRCTSLSVTLTLTQNDVTFGNNAFSYTNFSALDIRISANAPSGGEYSPFAYMSALETVTIRECAYQSATVDGDLFSESSHKISRFNLDFSMVPLVKNMAGFTRTKQYDAYYTLVYVRANLYNTYIERNNSWNLAPEDVDAQTVHFVPDDAQTLYTRTGSNWQGYTYNPMFLGKTVSVQEQGNWGQTTTQTRLILYAYIGEPLTGALSITTSTQYYYGNTNNPSQYAVRFIGYGCFSNMYLANQTALLTDVNITITGLTSIADRAFFRLSGVGTITINDMESYHSYIESGNTNGEFIGSSSYIEGDLGEYLFTFAEANEITLDTDIIAIGDYMFAYTKAISLIGGAENFKFIGYRAFYQSELGTLSLPAVVSILGLAFEESYISSLTIGSTWTYAAYNCFAGTTNLVEITMDTVDAAFNQDQETFEIAEFSPLVVYYPGDNETYLKSFPGLNILLTEYGNSSGTISTTGFMYMRYNASDSEIEITGYVGTDTAINLPETIDGYTVVSIAANVTGMENITSIRLNTSFRVYKPEAFDTMLSLTTFTVQSGNAYFRATNGILFAENGVLLVRYPISKTGTSYSTSTSNNQGRTTGIYAHAFYGCKYLESLTVNNYVTSIGHEAFAHSSIVTYRFNHTSVPPNLGSSSIFNIGTMQTINIQRRYITVFTENPFWSMYDMYFAQV